MRVRAYNTGHCAGCSPEAISFLPTSHMVAEPHKWIFSETPEIKYETINIHLSKTMPMLRTYAVKGGIQESRWSVEDFVVRTVEDFTKLTQSEMLS